MQLMSWMAVLCVNMVTVFMLLSVFFLPGDLVDCPDPFNFITAPQKMEALSGSCLLIPCNFTVTSTPGHEFDRNKQMFGVWIKTDPYFDKNPNNVVYNSSGTVNNYPMNITGNLSQKSCTTLFYHLKTSYSDKYYFRIINWPYRATFVCHPLQIEMKDSAPRPRIETPADLKEKQSVTITCSASTPCPHSPPKLTWSLQPDPHSSTEENTDGTFTTKIQQTITLSDKHDGYNISCSARFPVGEGKDVRTSETEETLRVSYSPKDTSASISPSGLVSAGTSVNLTCSSRARPPVSSYTWFKISQHGATRVSEGDVYSFNGTEGGAYYCVAANGLGNQTSPEIQLTIREESHLWKPVLGGISGIIVLICFTVCVWRLKSTHQSEAQTQTPTGEEPASQNEENLFYGELDFSNLEPEASSDSVRDSRQDTVYAEVKGSGNSTQTAGGPEELHSQVNKS